MHHTIREQVLLSMAVELAAQPSEPIEVKCSEGRTSWRVVAAAALEGNPNERGENQIQIGIDSLLYGLSNEPWCSCRLPTPKRGMCATGWSRILNLAPSCYLFLAYVRWTFTADLRKSSWQTLISMLLTGINSLG